MEATILIGRLILALVFTVAGIAKLADLPGSRQALRELGVRRSLAGALSIVLPILELTIAVLLLPERTAWWGAIGALALMLLFTAAIGYQLAHGRAPDCHCFGQLHSAPAGSRTLLRNGALALIAAGIVALGRDDPGGNTIAWIGELGVIEGALTVLTVINTVVLAGLAWLVYHLMMQQGRVLLQLDTIIEGTQSGEIVGRQGQPSGNGRVQALSGLPVGVAAPAFALPGVYGETMTLDALLAQGKRILLLFTDPGCEPCNALLPEISRWQQEYREQLTVALVSSGSIEANRVKLEEHGISAVLLQQDHEVAEAYKVRGTPSGVLVRSDGKIGTPVAAGPEAIRTLVSSLTAAPSSAALCRSQQMVEPKQDTGATPPSIASGTRMGEPAPDFELPDLEGRPVQLHQFQGEATMVLFWNPSCGFCKTMLPDLKQLETERPSGAPRILVVSTGSAEANRDTRLVSQVVLDPAFNTGRSFGVRGTPSAVLVDADGDIASDVAVGAGAVLELAVAPTTGRSA